MKNTMNHPAQKSAIAGKSAAAINAIPGLPVTGLATRSAALLMQLRREAAARTKRRST